MDGKNTAHLQYRMMSCKTREDTEAVLQCIINACIMPTGCSQPSFARSRLQAELALVGLPACCLLGVQFLCRLSRATAGLIGTNVVFCFG